MALEDKDPQDPENKETPEDKETPDKPEGTPSDEPETPDKPEAPTTPPPETPPEVDLTKIKEEVREEVVDKFISALRPSEGDGEEMPPWKKEGRNPNTYEEIANYVDNLAQKREEVRVKDVKTQQKEQVKQQDKYNEDMNKFWDGQLDDLRERGKLPKIGDAKDEKDVGLVAQKEMFAQMVEHNKKIAVDGEAAITNIKEFYYEHYKDPAGQPAGADAPVAGGRTQAGSSDKEGEYSYDEIRKARGAEDLMTS